MFVILEFWQLVYRVYKINEFLSCPAHGCGNSSPNLRLLVLSHWESENLGPLHADFLLVRHWFHVAILLKSKVFLGMLSQLLLSGVLPKNPFGHFVSSSLLSKQKLSMGIAPGFMQVLRVKLHKSTAGLLESLSVKWLFSAQLSVYLLSLDEVFRASHFFLLGVGTPSYWCTVRHLTIVKTNFGKTCVEIRHGLLVLDCRRILKGQV